MLQRLLLAWPTVSVSVWVGLLDGTKIFGIFLPIKNMPLVLFRDLSFDPAILQICRQSKTDISSISRFLYLSNVFNQWGFDAMCNFQISQVPQSNPREVRYASRASSMLSLDFKGTERPLSGCRQTLCGSCRWKCGGCRWKCGSCRWKCGSVEVVDAANSCRLCGRPPNGFPLVFPGGHWWVWLHLPLL